MKIVKYIDFLRAHMKGLKIALAIYLIVLLLFDVAIPRDEAHAHYMIDKIRLYWAVFGVVGCFVLIKVGKGIAHLFLSKDEDYYG